jgi:hypothetical protein
MRRSVFNPRAGGHLEERGVYDLPDQEACILIASRQAIQLKDELRDPEIVEAREPAVLTR